MTIWNGISKGIGKSRSSKRKGRSSMGYRGKGRGHKDMSR